MTNHNKNIECNNDKETRVILLISTFILKTANLIIEKMSKQIEADGAAAIFNINSKNRYLAINELIFYLMYEFDFSLYTSNDELTRKRAVGLLLLSNDSKLKHFQSGSPEEIKTTYHIMYNRLTVYGKLREKSKVEDKIINTYKLLLYYLASCLKTSNYYSSKDNDESLLLSIEIRDLPFTDYKDKVGPLEMSYMLHLLIDDFKFVLDNFMQKCIDLSIKYNNIFDFDEKEGIINI